MTRRQPLDPPPAVEKRTDDCITQVRRYKLITPLFGGGVAPQTADPVTVVRATEVRGHLRFWWRATRGGQFDGSLEEMRKAEGRIWGTAAAEGQSGPSKIDIVISASKGGTILRDTENRFRNGPPRVDLGHPGSKYSYVAFPLRSEDGKPAGVLREGIEFSLSLRFPIAFRDDIEAALWAWETFGGIGARTRRGFGALQCVDVTTEEKHTAIKSISVNEIQKEIANGLAKYVTNGQWPPHVPHLIVDFRISPQNGSANADAAWRHLFGKLKDFRQSRWPDTSGRPYGRSKWPEPDAIRNITKKSAPKHKVRKLPFDRFPRADFGLPIIFQFKEEDVRSGDPPQTVLQGAEHDRLASRLILRPLACTDGKSVGLAAVLAGPTQPPGGLSLQNAPGNPKVDSDLTPTEASRIDPLKANPDVLQAFLDYLK